MQKEVKLLSNVFSNKLNNFINNSSNKNIISHYKKNTTSFWLPTTKKNRVADHFKIKEIAGKKNRVTNYFKIK